MATKKQDIRTYPAIFTDNGKTIAVEYPDIPGCFTFGENPDIATRRAKEALEGFLFIMEQDNDPIPEPTPFSAIKTEPGQAVVLVSVRMDIVREEEANKSITKSVTLPSWLNQLALEAKINFSGTLQDALKAKLGL